MVGWKDIGEMGGWGGRGGTLVGGGGSQWWGWKEPGHVVGVGGIMISEAGGDGDDTCGHWRSIQVTGGGQ